MIEKNIHYIVPNEFLWDQVQKVTERMARKEAHQRVLRKQYLHKKARLNRAKHKK